MDKGACGATVGGITKSWTRLAANTLCARHCARPGGTVRGKGQVPDRAAHKQIHA